MKTGIVRDPLFIQHNMGPHHPESPERLIALYKMLDRPEFADKFINIPTREATKAEVCLVHNRSYFDQIIMARGKTTYLDPDTSTSPESVDAALTAVGGCLNALDMVWNRELDNAFALIRPPGHHAESGRAMGFCIFNNVAVAAAYALRTLGAKKVVILDWDLHHGNGTQNSFFDRKDMVYMSVHQYPYFPGTGDLTDVGWGEGEGHTVNIPLSVGYGDGDYLAFFEEIFLPIIREYHPDLLLVSAGFDTYMDDPLGGMKVTPKGYVAQLNLLKNLAAEYCNGRLMCFLEGGYHLQGLVSSVRECLNLLASDEQPELPEMLPLHPGQVHQMVKIVKKVQQRYWNCMK